MDPKELREYARRCLVVAVTTADAELAASLRKTAVENLDLADSIDPPAAQQQQQIQPAKKDEGVSENQNGEQPASVTPARSPRPGT